MTPLQARHELFRRGSLRFLLHAGQLKVCEAFEETQGKKLAVFLMQRRWGKSYLSAVLCVEKALSNPGSHSIFATAFQVDAREIIIPIFSQVLSDCPKDLYPTWNESKAKFVFKNGSEIVVVGIDANKEKLRGRFADLVIIDEAGFVGANLKQLYSSVLIPLTLKRDGARIIMLSTPPTKPGHQFFSFIEKAKIEGSFQKFTVYDNPMLSAEEIEEFRKEFLDENDWKREALCEEIRDVTRSVIPEWSESYIQ